MTEAERRKLPVASEADAVLDGVDMATPYLLQSTATANFIFSDAASIQYVIQNKTFSNFFQDLSMKISKFPNLHAVAVPGCTLFLPDLFSRQCDYVKFERNSMNLSPEQSSVLPALHFLKPGTIIDSDKLKEMLHAVPKAEFLDINEQSYSYIQKLDWSNYQNEVQPMTSEREFIIGALLNTVKS